MSGDKMREGFLLWVSTRKLVTRNNATLRMNSDQSQFLDYRVNDLWCAWKAAVSFQVNAEDILNEQR